MSNSLVSKKCLPCEGEIPPLSIEETQRLISELNNWKLDDHKEKISKELHFVNFRHTMDFVNQVANIAEEEGHHPDMYVSYGTLIITLSTHAIQGLSENDFILASKIDQL
jgi:4a-hydroxytetrahydrobiopterin dehydratase